MNFNAEKFFSKLYAKFFDDDVLGHAAQVAFYFSFSLFPLIFFLLTLFGLILETADEFRAELFLYLRQIMPGSAFILVRDTIAEVMEKSSGGKLTFGILVAIWSASAGFDSLRSSLNGVYNLKETRAWWTTKVISLLLTLGIGILIFFTLGLIFYGSQMISWVLPIESPYFLKPLEYLTITLVLLFTFALLYNFCPNHAPYRWKWISPGAVTGIVLWLLFSGGFRIYLRYFDTYSKTYGSLGAVIVLMLWLYLTALVILIGGMINAIFDEQAGIKKDTEDPEQIADEKKMEEKPVGEAIQEQK